MTTGRDWMDLGELITDALDWLLDVEGDRW